MERLPNVFTLKQIADEKVCFAKHWMLVFSLLKKGVTPSYRWPDGNKIWNKDSSFDFLYIILLF